MEGRGGGECVSMSMKLELGLGELHISQSTVSKQQAVRR
jgi:hypothetical protein